MAWTASLGVSAAVTTSLRRVGLRPLPVPLWWAVSSPGDTVCGSLRMFQQRSRQNRPSCWPATATTAASGACERTTRPPPGGPEAVASTVGTGRGHRLHGCRVWLPRNPGRAVCRRSTSGVGPRFRHRCGEQRPGEQTRQPPEPRITGPLPGVGGHSAAGEHERPSRGPRVETGRPGFAQPWSPASHRAREHHLN